MFNVIQFIYHVILTLKTDETMNDPDEECRMVSQGALATIYKAIVPDSTMNTD